MRWWHFAGFCAWTGVWGQRGHSWANALREQAASVIQSHCLNKTITFLKSRSDSTMKNPFRIRNEGFSRTYDTWGPLKTTRGRTVTQRAVCLSIPRHATITPVLQFVQAAKVMWLESCDGWWHVATGQYANNTDWPEVWCHWTGLGSETGFAG